VEEAPDGVGIGGLRDEENAALPNEKLTSPKVGTEVATKDDEC
jgi:hypothetical protein